MVQFIKKEEQSWLCHIRRLANLPDLTTRVPTQTDKRILIEHIRYLLFQAAKGGHKYLSLLSLQKLTWHFSAKSIFPRWFLGFYDPPWSRPFGQYSPSLTSALLEKSYEVL
jgi:hypothetical protein